MARVFCVVALLLPALAFGPAAPASSGTLGAIRVTVWDWETKERIKGATVTLQEWGVPFRQRLASLQRVPGVTDANGFITVTGLAPNVYLVSADSPGLYRRCPVPLADVEPDTAVSVTLYLDEHDGIWHCTFETIRPVDTATTSIAKDP